MRELSQLTDKILKSSSAVYAIIFAGIIIIALFNSGISSGLGPSVFPLPKISPLQPTSTPVNPNPNSQKINEGYQSIQQQDYSKASDIADEILANNPDNKEALSLKGQALRMNGDNEKSLAYFDRLLQVDPGNSGAWAQKGWAFESLTRWQEEADAFDNAIRLTTNTATLSRYWTGKGKALNGLRKYNESLSAFNKALQLDPNYSEIYTEIGKVYRNQGNYPEAIASIDKTIAAKPDYGWAYTAKGFTYERMKKWDEMLDAFETALRVGGNNNLQANAWNGKGRAFYQLKRYDEAMSAYNTAIQLYPARFETYTDKGKLLISNGNYRDAITEFDKSIEKNPNYSDAWWFKAVALENLGDHPGAGMAQARAASLDPVKYGSKSLPGNVTPEVQVTSKLFYFF